MKEQFEKDVCSKCQNIYCRKYYKFEEEKRNCYIKYLEEKIKVLKLNQCDGLECDLLGEVTEKLKGVEITLKVFMDSNKQIKTLKKDKEDQSVELNKMIKENEELKEKIKDKDIEINDNNEDAKELIGDLEEQLKEANND